MPPGNDPVDAGARDEGEDGRVQQVWVAQAARGEQVGAEEREGGDVPQVGGVVGCFGGDICVGCACVYGGGEGEEGGEGERGEGC